MIEFHADDYGMSLPSSLRIIECIEKGNINGISLMPNAPCFAESMELLQKECKRDIKMAIHLNLMTQRPLGDPGRLPDLVRPDGSFCVSYKKLLLASVLPGMRKRYMRQIKEELLLQIKRCLPYYPEGAKIRLDSHRHFHMVPVVFDSLAQLIEEEGLAVEYIRIIHEKPAFYKNISKTEHFRMINIVKAVLLNTLGCVDKRRQPALYKRGTSDFASILLSGVMTEKNLGLLLGNIKKHREKFRDDIELMFHPGGIFEKEDLEQITDEEDRKYMSDIMRKREMAAVMKQYGLTGEDV